MSQRQQSFPSAPTFDEYENPDSLLNVTARPAPMYDGVAHDVERSVPDVEKPRAAKKIGCKSRTKIVLKVGLTLMLVTIFILTFVTLADISRLKGEVGKISETVYSHHTTTTTTSPRPPTRLSYNWDSNDWDYYNYY